MVSVADGPQHDGLRIEWRRRLVLLGAAAGVAALLVVWIPATPAPFVHAVHLIAAAVGVGVLWFLADCLHPWLADPDEVDSTERAHANAAVQRSYTILFVVAVFLLLLGMVTDVWDSSSMPAMVNFLVGAILLMPLATAAWTIPDNTSDGSGVGPVDLVRRRFRGYSAVPYAMGSLAAVLMIPLLAIATRPSGSAGAGWSRWGIIAVLIAALVCGWLLLRVLLEHSLRRSDSSRH